MATSPPSPSASRCACRSEAKEGEDRPGAQKTSRELLGLKGGRRTAGRQQRGLARLDQPVLELVGLGEVLAGLPGVVLDLQQTESRPVGASQRRRRELAERGRSYWKGGGGSGRPPAWVRQAVSPAMRFPSPARRAGAAPGPVSPPRGSWRRTSAGGPTWGSAPGRCGSSAPPAVSGGRSAAGPRSGAAGGPPGAAG